MPATKKNRQVSKYDAYDERDLIWNFTGTKRLKYYTNKP